MTDKSGDRDGQQAWPEPDEKGKAWSGLMSKLLAEHILIVNGKQITGYSLAQMAQAFGAGVRRDLRKILRKALAMLDEHYKRRDEG